ncbi:MAG: hypothetical protein KGZ43_06670, partial [Sulfuritalea sp.]|nr:hypothetical protein [Sulfuritalea sp.]
MDVALVDPSPWLIVLPLLWAMFAFLLGPGRGGRVAIVGMLVQTALAVDLAGRLIREGVRVHAVGGWGAPLGIDLHADGLTAVMLLLTQGVGLTLFVYAWVYLAEQKAKAWFWPLAGLMVAAMNALLLSADLFNIYVTLELLGLSAVALVTAGGRPAQVRAALRYLLVGLVASGAYLLGVALIYGVYGTVAIADLALRVTADAPLSIWLAGILMFVGLLAKTALFPFHFWLPPAHGSAPVPVSALLSALVVKVSFYLVLRLWLGPFAPLTDSVGWLAGLLGAAAILWGSWRALRA